MAALLPVTACAARAATRAPAPTAPTDIGVTPTAPLNPSDPPNGAPVATGVRAGDATLLLWFTRLSPPVALDYGWYDPRTGRRTDGPQPSMGWNPDYGTANCFLDLIEMPMPEGDLLDLGLLTAPAGTVLLTQHGRTAAANVAPWSADRGVVAFWIRRVGRPVTWQDTKAGPDTPVFTAADEHGRTLCRQQFISRYRDVPQRQDG
jgi:hypothetical protein